MQVDGIRIRKKGSTTKEQTRLHGERRALFTRRQLGARLIMSPPACMGIHFSKQQPIKSKSQPKRHKLVGFCSHFSRHGINPKVRCPISQCEELNDRQEIPCPGCMSLASAVTTSWLACQRPPTFTRGHSNIPGKANVVSPTHSIWDRERSYAKTMQTNHVCVG